MFPVINTLLKSQFSPKFAVQSSSPKLGQNKTVHCPSEFSLTARSQRSENNSSPLTRKHRVSSFYLPSKFNLRDRDRNKETERQRERERERGGEAKTFQTKASEHVALPERPIFAKTIASRPIGGRRKKLRWQTFEIANCLPARVYRVTFGQRGRGERRGQIK